MPELILFNYPLSPFSEKIRLMLGYTGLPWRSVVVPAMPPRPGLTILTGGYRRIPVAQIGADVFCDTRTIAAQIAGMSGKPELAIENCSAEAQTFAAGADPAFFLAVFSSAPGALLRRLLRETGLRNTWRFIVDRIGIARRAKLKAATGAQARELVAAQVLDMEKRLSADFLFGDSPCAADFSAAYGLWFAQVIGARLPPGCAAVDAWLARMQAFGHGLHSELSMDDALGIARQAEPEALGKCAVEEPRPVGIAPGDYARDPVRGLLVGEDAHRWVLSRAHAEVGTVHVHFPRAGFVQRSLA